MKRLAVLALLALTGCDDDRPENDPLEEGYSSVYRGSDIRVIDGDTIAIGSRRIRLVGIDTPEVDGQCPYERQQAARATQRLRELISTSSTVVLVPQDGPNKDRYGRYLRWVGTAHGPAGVILRQEGLAREWTGRRESWC